MYKLGRFIKAQEDDYQNALNEIKNGKKESCWMWYIFPQITGLGKTSMSETYAIQNIEEAVEYLKDEILRKRLIEISQALLDLKDDNIHEILGSPDDLKLRSSMTLFKKAEEISDIKCENIFQKILDKYYKGEDDPLTLNILNKQKQDKEEKKAQKEKEEEQEENMEKQIEKEENNEKEESSEKNEDNKKNEIDKNENNINNDENNKINIESNSDSEKSENSKDNNSQNKNEMNNINERNENHPKDEEDHKSLNSLKTFSTVEMPKENDNGK